MADDQPDVFKQASPLDDIGEVGPPIGQDTSKSFGTGSGPTVLNTVTDSFAPQGGGTGASALGTALQETGPARFATPLDDIGEIAPSDVSTAGAAARGAVHGALPAAGAMAGAGAGAEAGAAGGALVAPFLGPFAPAGPLLGGLAGGIAGAIGGGMAAEKVQDYTLSKLPDSVVDAFGQGDRQQQLDQQYKGGAYWSGGMLPYMLTMQPTKLLTAAKDLPEGATALQRLMANPVTARLFGGGVMGGMELGQEAVQGQVDWRKVGIATGFGIVFNKPNALGEAITEMGAAPARRLLGRQVVDQSPPTIAQAADTKIMGPGITEAVFQGSHEQAPEAAMAAQQTARDERVAQGDHPEPDVHAIAQQMEPELFARYDELQARQKVFGTSALGIDTLVALEGHLAATNAELEKIAPEIAAAYRRAADTMGVETVPAEPHATIGDMLAEQERGLNAQAPEAPETESGVPGIPASGEAGAAAAGPDGTVSPVAPGAESWQYGYREDDGRIYRITPDGRKEYLYENTKTNESHFIDAEKAVPSHVVPRQFKTEEKAGKYIQDYAPIGEEPDNGFGSKTRITQRSIGDQRAFIADDVARRLIAAGRPEDEARATGHVVAARYVTRAGRFDGKLGSAEELYAKDGAAIAGPNGKALAPAAPPRDVTAAAETAAREKAAIPASLPGIVANDFASAVRVKNEWRASTPFTGTTEYFITASKPNQEALAAAGKEIASALGLDFKDPGVKADGPGKGLDRLKSKAERFGAIGSVTDQVRAGFNTATPAQADQIAQRLGQKFQVIDEGWQTTPSGYFDRKLYIRFPDGMIGEVQMWPPGMLQSKSAGHKLYEGARELPPWHPLVPEFNQAQGEVYEPVRAALSAEWKAVLGSGGTAPNVSPNLARESTEPLSPTSAALTSDHEPLTSAQASEGVQKAGSPSQEQALMSDMFGISNENVGGREPTVNGQNGKELAQRDFYSTADFEGYPIGKGEISHDLRDEWAEQAKDLKEDGEEMPESPAMRLALKKFDDLIKHNDAGHVIMPDQIPDVISALGKAKADIADKFETGGGKTTARALSGRVLESSIDNEITGLRKTEKELHDFFSAEDQKELFQRDQSGAKERYDAALARGDITPAEHAGFMDALGVSSRVASPFASVADARTELNEARSVIEKYNKKHDDATSHGGPRLTTEESQEWKDSFSRLSKAQQYLMRETGKIPFGHVPSDNPTVDAARQRLSIPSRWRELAPEWGKRSWEKYEANDEPRELAQSHDLPSDDTDLYGPKHGQNRMPITDDGGKQVGAVDYSEDEHAVRMKYPQVEVSEQGKGLGVGAYQKIADYALAKGKDIWSDRAVTTQAQSLYDAMERRGYTVERNPDFMHTPDSKISKDGKPLYKITAGPKELLQKNNDLLAIKDAQGAEPPEEGMVRLYRGGGNNPGGPKWVTTSRKQAERYTIPGLAYGAKAGTYLQYVDVPKSDPRVQIPEGHSELAVEIGPDIADKLQPFYRPKELSQTANASIRPASWWGWNPQPFDRSLIKFFKSANASSGIHEFSHGWLEEMRKDSAHPEAPQGLRDDMQTVNDWLGVGENGEIKTKQHEKFARGFEQYMREGVAPSKELAGVFAQFRNWLLQIYQSLKGLGTTEISPEMRNVFDRMLEMEPQRTVIAPERLQPDLLHDIHEADAAHTPPHEAEPAMDRIIAERDRYITEQPPEIQRELETAAQKVQAAQGPAGEAAGAPGEAFASPGGPGQVGEGGGGSGPEPGGGGGGAEHGAQQPGGGGAGAESNARPDPRSQLDRDPGTALAPGPAQSLGGRSSPFTDKAGNIRLENLTNSADVRQAIHDAAEENNDFIGDRRGIVTPGQVSDLANDIGLPGAMDMVEKWVKGQAYNAEQVVILRRLLRASAFDLGEKMRQAAIGTDEDVMAYAEARDRHMLIQRTVAGAAAEAGRALAAFRNIAGEEGAASKAIDELVKIGTGKTLFQLKAEAKMGAKLDTPEKISRFMQDAQKRNFGRGVLEYFVNALISGPITHITYGVGNEVSSILRAGPETLAAAAIGHVRKALGREGEVVHAGEALAQYRARYGTIPASIQAAMEAARTGMTTLLPGEEIAPGHGALTPFEGDTNLATAKSMTNEPVSWNEAMGSAFGAVRGIKDAFWVGGTLNDRPVGLEYSPLGQIPDVRVGSVNIPIGTAVRLPGRLVAAEHSFFRTANYAMERSREAFRIATDEGLTGSARNQRIAEIELNPSQEQMDRWIAASTHATLMGQGGAFVRKLSAMINHEFNVPGIGPTPMLKFMDPFIKISGNIIEQSLIQRTPIGLLSQELRADLMGKNGNIAQDNAQARMLVGTGLALLSGSLAAQGYVTGSGPSDPKEAAMWQLAGNQAHSVRIGDFWYQINKLGPYGVLTGIAADLYDVAHEASDGDMLKAAMHLQHAFTQNILDESFMKGPADLIKAVDDPGRYGENYIKSFASSFTPFSSGFYQVNRMIDPYQRETRSVVDAIKAKLPGLSETLMPRRDVWGQPMPSREGAGYLTSIYVQKMNEDPVNRAMLEAQFFPGQVEKKIRNIELTPEEHDDFAKVAGVMTKQNLDRLVTSPNWDTLPMGSKQLAIKHIVEACRETARGIIMARYPHIPLEAAQQKAETMTTGKKH